MARAELNWQIWLVLLLLLAETKMETQEKNKDVDSVK